MRILGIDPGLRITGYGIVEVDPSDPGSDARIVEGGVIRIPTDLPLPVRLRRLHEDVLSVIDDLAPGLVSVESVFAHPERAATGVRMGHARGVILLAAAMRGIEVVEHAPAQVKKSLTGDGSADKARMQLAIAARCRLDAPPEPPDVADALAIALCAAHRLDGPEFTSTASPDG